MYICKTSIYIVICIYRELTFKYIHVGIYEETCLAETNPNGDIHCSSVRSSGV